MQGPAARSKSQISKTGSSDMFHFKNWYCWCPSNISISKASQLEKCLVRLYSVTHLETTPQLSCLIIWSPGQGYSFPPFEDYIARYIISHMRPSNAPQYWQAKDLIPNASHCRSGNLGVKSFPFLIDNIKVVVTGVRTAWVQLARC